MSNIPTVDFLFVHQGTNSIFIYMIIGFCCHLQVIGHWQKRQEIPFLAKPLPIRRGFSFLFFTIVVGDGHMQSLHEKVASFSPVPPRLRKLAFSYGLSRNIPCGIYPYHTVDMLDGLQHCWSELDPAESLVICSWRVHEGPCDWLW